jgi:uncharacterized protein
VALLFNRPSLLLTRCGAWQLDLALAGNSAERARGLMGRPALRCAAQRSQGLLLKACTSVHGCFVAGDLDLVYLDAQAQVTQTAVLRSWSWHIATRRGGRRPVQVLELPVGVVLEAGVREGDWLLLGEVADAPSGRIAAASAWSQSLVEAGA